MRIDSHQHFWKYSPDRHQWISDEMKALRRDFLPEDLVGLLGENELDGCVAVQADQSEEENRFLIDLADSHSFIKGVVGWVDLRSEHLDAALERYSEEPIVKGFRHVVQDEPKGFLEDEQFIQGVKALGERGFSYDLLIYERQLEEAVSFIQKLPEMRIVVDHIAKPDIRNHSFSDWKKYMEHLSGFPHISVKISGMVTEANWETWDRSDFVRYIDVLMERFGPNRLMYGSDWPVCLLAGTYREVKVLFDQLIQQLSENEKEKICGLNATQFYKL